MRLRGEKVEERRRWKGIEVTSVLKMFKQQKPQRPVNQDLNQNIPAILITPATVPQSNRIESNKMLTMIATQKKHLSHIDLPTQVKNEEKFWPKALIKTSPAHFFAGPTYTGGGGGGGGEGARHLLPTRGNPSSGGFLLRQQGEAKLRQGEATGQQCEAELRGEERHLRRFEGRVRVLSTSSSSHNQNRMRRSRTSRTSSTCSFTSTKRRRRRRGRSFGEGGGGGGGGGGVVERRRSQYCAPPSPSVSPLRPNYQYKTLYPGII